MIAIERIIPKNGRAQRAESLAPSKARKNDSSTTLVLDNSPFEEFKSATFYQNIVQQSPFFYSEFDALQPHKFGTRLAFYVS
jgi:hypothetical protein